MRLLRRTLRLPSESDFSALALFPDIDGALYLDVGANRGQSADSILLTQKRARLHLFEPNAMLYEKLRSLFGGDARVAIDNFGLGDETVQGVLVVPFYKRWMFDGLGSFNEQGARDWLKGRIYFYRDRCLTLRRIASDIRRLDELELDPFFIKLDIQGFEYRALKGAEQTIRRCRPVIMIESADQRVVDFLRGFGYQYYAFKHGRFIAGVKGDTNTFFMTEERRRLVA